LLKIFNKNINFEFSNNLICLLFWS